MITESIIDMFLLLPTLIINALPSLDVSIPADLFDTITSIFYGIGYVLPLVRLAPIVVMELAISLFKIVIAIVLRVKSFIPTMGGT